MFRQGHRRFLSCGLFCYPGFLHKGVAPFCTAVVTFADGAPKGSRVQGPGYRVNPPGVNLVMRTNSWPVNPGAHEP